MHVYDRQSFRPSLGWLVAVAWLVCIGWPLHAATVTPTANDGPPMRVARVSWQAGAVSLLPAGSSQWQAVNVNRPLQSGDQLATDAGARVELQLGDAVAHLAGNTDFGFLALGQWQTQLALTQGTAELNVNALPDGQDIEIDTPQVAVVIDRSARVRVDTGNGGASMVTVRRGSVVVHGKDGALRVLDAGQRYRFDSPVLADAQALTFTGGDAFDNWCRARDQWYAAANSGDQYVSAGTVGYQDLDHYGQWQQEGGYGAVWFPDDVATDWVPYRQGRWAWIAPWGWTWVSSESWGFAPFHYGRWAVIGGRWGWWPGAVGVRAVYAPALVGFVGGHGWSVSVGLGVGGGPVGWYPLGPGMIYNPWYAANWGYYERVNCCYRHDWHDRHHDHRRWSQHVRASYNLWRKPEHLRHIRYLGKPPIGITAVSRQTMARGRYVATARLHVAGGHWRRAPVRYHGLKVAPHARRPAVWRPAQRAQAPQVVALHRPEPSAALRHAPHALAVSHVARVHLLASDTWAARHPTQRPLMRRDVAGAVPARPFAVGSEHALRAHAMGHAARTSNAVRGPVRPALATLPQVQRLQAFAPPPAAYRATRRPRPAATSLPRVTRLQSIRQTSRPARHLSLSVPARPAVWKPPVRSSSRPAFRERFRPAPRAPAWPRRAAPPRPYHPMPSSAGRALSFRPTFHARPPRAVPSQHAPRSRGRARPVHRKSKTH